MKTTADFLDELQRKLGVESDYALGKEIGLQRQQVSHYRNLKGTFDDEKCMKIAELLGIDAAEIILAMHYQRAKQPEVKAIWERMAMNIGALGGVAATVLIVLALPYAGANSGLENVGLIGSIAAAGSTGIEHNSTLCVFSEGQTWHSLWNSFACFNPQSTRQRHPSKSS